MPLPLLTQRTHNSVMSHLALPHPDPSHPHRYLFNKLPSHLLVYKVCPHLNAQYNQESHQVCTFFSVLPLVYCSPLIDYIADIRFTVACHSLMRVITNVCATASITVGLSGTDFLKYLVNATIPERIRTMEIKFDQLLDKTQDGLVDNNIPLQKLKRCITRLPAHIKDQHFHFIKENLSEIKESKCAEDIFLSLHLYWNFLNYTLLEHIVNEFGNNDTKLQWQCMCLSWWHFVKPQNFQISSPTGHAQEGCHPICPDL